MRGMKQTVTMQDDFNRDETYPITVGNAVLVHGLQTHEFREDLVRQENVRECTSHVHTASHLRIVQLQERVVSHVRRHAAEREKYILPRRASHQGRAIRHSHKQRTFHLRFRRPNV